MVNRLHNKISVQSSYHGNIILIQHNSICMSQLLLYPTYIIYNTEYDTYLIHYARHFTHIIHNSEYDTYLIYYINTLPMQCIKQNLQLTWYIIHYILMIHYIILNILPILQEIYYLDNT